MYVCNTCSFLSSFDQNRGQTEAKDDDEARDFLCIALRNTPTEHRGNLPVHCQYGIQSGN